MKTSHKELLKQLSKDSHDYFEVTEGKHPELVEELNNLIQGEYVQLTINKRCYLVQQDTYDFVGYQTVTFTNLSTTKNLNLSDL
ncbi:hypothetical protein NVP1063O_120 [Vibrio phage 1.063.O._10N.261.45.C7]|nr:hypothetical protein NVP1063O_120 [Vibrio phage 1.063.O._10N.261.45.C7]